MVVLTASYRLGSAAQTDAYYRNATQNLVSDNPKWIYFAQSVSGSGVVPVTRPKSTVVWAPNSAFLMEMSGTSTRQSLTMFATAPKGTLNQSSNPTFTQYTSNTVSSTGKKTYVESKQLTIKNVVSSSYNDPTGSFEKTTYISKVGIYDEERNLIGVAKLAMPVRKTATRDFTVKIKTDL